MSWRNALSVKSALAEATRRWPNRSKASDGTVGDTSHSRRKSDHNPDASGIVHAFDLTHDPSNGVNCDLLSKHLVQKKDKRVKYIIWNKKICNARDWTWKDYSGSNPHTKHMHVSIHSTTQAENDTSDWWNTKRTNINVVMYYIKSDGDRAFQRAARTFAASKGFCMDVPLTHVSDIKRAWQKVQNKCENEFAQVNQMAIFSHASKSGDKDGLEFLPSVLEDGTLSRGEIMQLPVLTWAPTGKLILASCNSGVMGTRGWSPAQAFAARQKVKTIGTSGYAYFSKSFDRYIETTANDQTLYLWAYRRRRNGMFGGGERMADVVFR